MILAKSVSERVNLDLVDDHDIALEHPDSPSAAAQPYRDRQGLGFGVGRVRR
jgi:hypothetical protein